MNHSLETVLIKMCWPYQLCLQLINNSIQLSIADCLVHHNIARYGTGFSLNV